MEEEKLRISVHLAERKYMLSVLPSEEAGVRNAVEFINQQIRELASKYAFKDRQDILAMLALLNSNKMLEYEKNISFMNETFVKRLHDIDALIDQTLTP
jgi:cell division protein ZapA (FtsZ GTPase activity inhibitor)